MKRPSSFFYFYVSILIIIILYFSYLGSRVNRSKENFDQSPQKVAVVSMIKSPKNMETWLEKHRNLGIARFYIRLEDTPELEEYLEKQSDVHLIIGRSTGINEYKEIQTRQGELVNQALRQGEKDGMDWVIHIDSDEILEGDLDQVRSLPPNVRTFWIQNHEAKYADIPKKEDNCFTAAKYLDCSKEACVSYANGKSGGRCAPDVAANGPHRFKSNLSDNPDPDLKLEGIRVNHYESCDFEQYKAKYRGLSVQDLNNDIPFSYYNDSIKAVSQGDHALQKVYTQYRVVSDGN